MVMGCRSRRKGLDEGSVFKLKGLQRGKQTESQVEIFLFKKSHSAASQLKGMHTRKKSHRTKGKGKGKASQLKRKRKGKVSERGCKKKGKDP